MASIISLHSNGVYVNILRLCSQVYCTHSCIRTRSFFVLFLMAGLNQAFAWVPPAPHFLFNSSGLKESCNSVLAVNPNSAMMVDPIITVRLANPQYNCSLEEYCLDVEFKSNMANTEVFGMNVRFFYDDLVLELINFRGFQGGYAPLGSNPPPVSYSATAGPAWFNFGGGCDFVNGAIQKANCNASPIILSTTVWTKLFQICFTVDDPNANVDNFCPSVVWDLEVNPDDGSFFAGSAGVVITQEINNCNSATAFRAVNQFNWNYIGNGTPPYGQPAEITCSSINCGGCNLIVNNGANSGPGSLRDAIECAVSGDTIGFASNMAGATISITTTRLIINKNLYIRSNLNPKVKVTSTIPGLFEVQTGKTLEVKDLEITSGTTITGNAGAAFTNFGILRLIGTKVFKNTNLPSDQYLIRNKPGSQFITIGNCLIEIP